MNTAHEMDLATTLGLNTRHVKEEKPQKISHHTEKMVGCNTPIDPRHFPPGLPTAMDKYPVKQTYWPSERREF